MRIAVIVENSSWYGRQIIDGVAAYAQANRNLSLVWGNPRSQSFERRLASCQGVIARVTSHAMKQALCRAALPVVDVFCGLDCPEFYGVDSDHETIGRMAAEYFLSKKYSTLAFVGFRGVAFSEQRLRGFSDAMRESDCSLIVHESEMKNNNQTFYNDEIVDVVNARKLTTWLRQLPKPSAIFAANDLMASQISRLASENGIRIPEDVVLLGVDNDSQLCAFADKPLSTIDPNAVKIGYSAARILLSVIQKKPDPKRHHIYRVPPGELIERASTFWYDISPDWLADVLGFIDASLDKPLSAVDIVSYVGLSHVAIGKMFRKKLGVSPQKYITNLKMDKAKRLLETNNDLSVKEVAIKLGYSSLAYFCNAYRLHWGHSPRR